MKEKKKGLAIISEFKEFISRGNVIDMAVGLVIGSSFTAIVNSLVNDVFMPAIGYIIGGIDFEDFAIILSPATADAEAVTIKYGLFIEKIINFLVIAAIVFLMVKAINMLRRKKAAEEAAPAPEPEPVPVPEDVALLTEIRDLLRENRDAGK